MILDDNSSEDPRRIWCCLNPQSRAAQAIQTREVDTPSGLSAGEVLSLVT